MLENIVQAKQINSEKGRYYKVNVGGNIQNLYSVTTILSATKSEEDKASIKAWQDKVGLEEAERIKNEAAELGTQMHEYIEEYLYTSEDGLNLEFPEFKDSKHYIQYRDAFLKPNNIEPLLIEGRVYWQSSQGFGFAGSVDLVAKVNGELCIVDHKSSRKKKKREWIEDYELQVAAYTKAINKLYDLDIRKAFINVATAKSFESFELDEYDLKEAWGKFYKRMKQFYKERQNEVKKETNE